MELDEGKPKEVEFTIPLDLASALNNPDVKKTYANGFIVVHGNADVSIIWQQLGQPVGVSQMSFTLAKTLVQKLGRVILDLEREAGHEFLTTGDIDRIKGESK